MRRRYLLRFDIWLCLLLAYGLSLGTAKLTTTLLPPAYESYVEEHTVADGEIGGRAGTDVPRVRSVEELLRQERFTIVSPGIEYRNRGAGYHNGDYAYAVTLPSGEVVAAVINMESVQQEGDYYTSDHTLPVGQVVYNDLTKDEAFLNQIQYGGELSRTDFYVDMRGKGGKVTQEDYSEHYAGIVQVATLFLSFPLFHSLGAHLGIFPFFIAPRRKEGEPKSEWD